MKNFLKFALTSSLLFNLSSCTKTEVKHQRYTESNWETPSSDEIVLDIFSTSNFSGAVNNQVALYPDGSESEVKYGGITLLNAYRDISLQKKEAITLWVDSGGSFDPLADNIHHKVTAYALEKLNYDALAFTDKELSILGVTLPTNNNVPFINSHLVDLANGESFETEKIKPWRIVEKSGLKIGIIAVSDYSSVKQSSSSRMKGLYFEDMVLGVLRAKRAFRNKNINFTILLAHVDSACHNNSNAELICPQEGDPLKKLILRLPPQTIDLVIASSGRISSGLIQDIPLIMTPGQGQWLGRARMHFDAKTKTIKDDGRELMTPVRVCDKFYHATNDCHIPFLGEETQKQRVKLLKETSNELKPAKFWGHEVIIDPKIDEEISIIRKQGSL